MATRAKPVPLVNSVRRRLRSPQRLAPGEVLTPPEERLLRDLVAQAGLILDNVGLGLELQQRLHQIAGQAAELQATAKRIVAVQYEARRNIERDLHDAWSRWRSACKQCLSAPLPAVTRAWPRRSTTSAASCPTRGRVITPTRILFEAITQ